MAALEKAAMMDQFIELTCATKTTENQAPRCTKSESTQKTDIFSMLKHLAAYYNQRDMDETVAVLEGSAMVVQFWELDFF